MAQAVVGKSHRAYAYSPRSIRSTGSCSSSTHTEQHSKSVAGTCSRDNAKRCSVHLAEMSGSVEPCVGSTAMVCTRTTSSSNRTRANHVQVCEKHARTEARSYLRVYPSSETARNLFPFAGRHIAYP